MLRILKDKSHLLPQLSQRIFFCIDGLPPVFYISRVGPEESIQVSHKCDLAGAGPPCQSQKLSLANGKGDVPEGMHCLLAR